METVDKPSKLTEMVDVMRRKLEACVLAQEKHLAAAQSNAGAAEVLREMLAAADKLANS
jgi:hypothetical protein